LKNYRISPKIWDDFIDYTKKYEQGQGDGTLLQGSYGQSYWFYYHFAEFIKK